MMNTLIVCIDNRGEILGKTLQNYFNPIYWICGDKIKILSRNEFIPTDISKLPSEFDVLFFHTGRNDPRRIPKNIKIKREFAFTSGRHPYKERTGVIHISREFSEDVCPIIKENIQEFIDFISDKTSELPAICKPLQTTTLLKSICILCQGYLVSHFSDPSKISGEIKKILDEIGWSKLAKENKGVALANSISKKSPITKNLKWWGKAFKDIDNADRLIEKIKKEIEPKDVSPQFIKFINDIYGIEYIKDPNLVANIYLEIKNLLTE